MTKKFILTSVLVIVLIMTMQFAVSAASKIAVDVADPEFWVDIQQDQGAASNVHTKEKAFDGSPTTRWAGYAAPNLTDANCTGTATQDPVTGGISTNMIIPLGKVYTLEEITLIMYNTNGREFYFNIFVSNDNKTWTKVGLSGDATPGSYTHTVTMPTPIDCFKLPQTVPAETGKAYSQTFSVKFATAASAKYVKIQAYGYTNSLATPATGEWFAVSEIELFGTEVVATSAPVIPVDVTNPEFWVDIQQDTGANAANPNKKENAFDGDLATRWAGYVAESDANCTGSATKDENGNLSTNMVIPLDKVYTLEEITIRMFANAASQVGREFTVNVWVSNDNVNWTKVQLTGDAVATTYTSSKVPVSADCFILPALVREGNNSQLYTIKLVTPTNAKYVKIQSYGFKTATSTGDWFAPAEIQLLGTESTSTTTPEVPATTAPETTVPAESTTAPDSTVAVDTTATVTTPTTTAQTTTKGTTTSPSTSDISVIIFIAIAGVSLAGVVLAKKGFAKK